eukprot:CAMPEP_0201284298 /NCGR_PEP_ID=MMETSP1317-20130820/69404_1 /ASSEMBLY_ACC=CAM_ASM_000770 /TAXON_ID=187299 /ORGANISM="Undescribed Undescribed, Strain Undescribed" /LENGTH=85 /DNA_ID=CAMNT_0047603867 /DNA_START=452 /DNA_END=706 /DNA_ORIENTATION=+
MKLRCSMASRLSGGSGSAVCTLSWIRFTVVASSGDFAPWKLKLPTSSLSNAATKLTWLVVGSFSSSAVKALKVESRLSILPEDTN